MMDWNESLIFSIAESSKDRLQARSIIEAMIANRQHADLATAFTEAWDRGDHWRVAIRTSIANLRRA
jgi:hypothetical protein